ncbi:PaaI family thioesterase [Aquabacterium sp. OR-4]|uniref:PaaI family thioesterase n=1 Tax=Aquabacterium sp. OR-4 TaxID=2978127 RepID=UPI0021B19BF2|nr:PaaI family thioesterase [Aquabacterium sp. OR-4]MDT7837363.1 PaaI family thioesterase [Aquabacterium sp. OR-4]
MTSHPTTPPAAASPSAPDEASPPEPALHGRERHVPFIAHLGIHRVRADHGEALIELTLRPELCNNHGGGHGGVMMTLLDCAMAHAALSRIDYSREVVTVDMHIAFMHPASGRLQATGRATGGGRSVCFCEAEIRDDHGHVIAKSMGTFRYRAPATGDGPGRV